MYRAPNALLVAFRERLEHTCPTGEVQLIDDFLGWLEQFAQEYAQRELSHAGVEAANWVYCLVDAIVTIDFSINSSSESRRTAKHWANTIKSCRGYVVFVSCF